MKPVSCRTCGTELLPETKFCRKCGTAISVGELDPTGSEEPTSLLRQPQGVATQQLSARATGGQQVASPSANVVEHATQPTRRSVMWRGIAIGVAVVVLILALASAVAVVRLRTHRADDSSLVYPGATTVLNITNEGGGRALQLKTTDSFEKVADWYEKSLKPEKRLQLTPSSMVMKNEKATATIVGTENETNIVVKIVP